MWTNQKLNISWDINNFISIYIALIVPYNLKFIIYVELQNWSEAIQLRLLHCCVALNIIMSKQKKLSATICHSVS